MDINRIHVAGILDLAEAEMLVDCGIRRLGFPLRLAYHREDLSGSEAAAIVKALSGTADCFVITYLKEASAIAELCHQVGVRSVQLHGAIDTTELIQLRAIVDGIHVIKSLIVDGENSDALVAEIDRLSPLVDAFITDTYDPRTGACGATGKTHDWSVSRALVKHSTRPVILAGGLHPGNVADAIRIVRPSGVDVHTGVEGPDGRKQRARVQAFLAAVETGCHDLQNSWDPG